MSHIVNAGTTSTDTALITAKTFSPTIADPTIYRVASNRAVHLLVSKAGTVATVANAMLVPVNCVEIVRMAPGESLSFILATGEVSGDIWFTEQAGS